MKTNERLENLEELVDAMALVLARAVMADKRLVKKYNKKPTGKQFDAFFLLMCHAKDALTD